MEYALRLHSVSEDAQQRLKTLLSGIDGSYVMCKETDATRDHLQGWVRCGLQQQTLRKRVIKMFPECVGDKGYSLTKVRSMEDYGDYTLKGTEDSMPDVVAYCGIELTEQYIADAHRRYWSKKKKPGKSNKAVVEEVTDWALSQGWEGDMYQRRWDVAKQVCDVIVGKKKPLNAFYAKGVYNAVMYRLDGGFAKTFVEGIIDKGSW